MKKLSSMTAVVLLSVIASPAAFAAIDVSTAAGTFTTDFTTAAAVVGGAMISGAFVAVVYKWIKATIFG